MDPEVERFSNILQKVGVHTEFTDWLAHKDGEGQLEGRFKNAVEGTGLGAAAEGLFQAARYWRARLRGDHADGRRDPGRACREARGRGPRLHHHRGPRHPPRPRRARVCGRLGGRPRRLHPPGLRGGPRSREPPEVQAQQPRTAEKPCRASPGRARGQGSRHWWQARSSPPMDPKQMAKAMGDPEAADQHRQLQRQAHPRGPGREVGPIDRNSIDSLARDIEQWRSA
jgi:hypothetical protein